LELEIHQLDLRYEPLRVRRAEAERRLLGSLSESGQQVPIVVVALADEPGRYVVIDGHRRLRALRRLGRDTVSAMVWPVSEAEALLADRGQRQSARLSALESGWLLRELSERHGLSGEELATRLGRSPSWVSRHLGLVREIPPAVQEQVRAGRLPAQAVMKYLLPIYRVRPEDAEALAAAAVRGRLSSRDLGELYRAWTTASEPVRARLVAEPELFLRARREMSAPDPRPEATVDRMTRDLDLVGVLVRRCTRLLRTEGGLASEERARLSSLAAQAAADLGRLQRQLEEVDTVHADAPATHDDPGAVCAGDEPAPDREEPEALPPGREAGDPLRTEAAAAPGAPEPRRRAPDAAARALRVMQGQPGPGP
jgi:ParB family chromosome partitioning protein